MNKSSPAAGLGYDPRPELQEWRGTPIPPLKRPLKHSSERHRIASYVWWNGPPWTVLRNASHYLWHVMDYGQADDIHFTLKDVPRRLWLAALADARPGQLSKGSYELWSLVLGRVKCEDPPCDWPDNAHRLDIRPLAGDTRERLYERHRRAHERRLRSTAKV